jgi:predicted ATPase
MPGGFTLEAAEAVCAGEGIEHDEVLDLLTGLIDKSLVVSDNQHSKTARYQLLEPIRQYSAKKLQSSGEEVMIHKRHQNWYLVLAQAAEPKLYGPEQAMWVDRLEAEHGEKAGFIFITLLLDLYPDSTTAGSFTRL